MTSDDYSSLFKSKYKFIEFKKQTNNSNTPPTSSNHQENIKQFYQDLISKNESAPQTPINKPKKTTKKEQVNKSPIQTNKNEFLKAAQDDNLKLIKSYLEDAQFDLSVCDEFKWNALMIAVASRKNTIVNYFINEHFRNSKFREFLHAKDSSGNDAESLAVKFENKEALELIKKAKSLLDFKESNDQPEQVEASTSNKNDKEDVFEYFCKSCGELFKTSDQKHTEHLTSIVHQLNESELNVDESKKKLINYHLRASTNKGYQMLLKSGWNELGLGANEQGKTQPIKARQKLDRYGIGVESEDKYKISHKLDAKSLRLKKSDSARSSRVDFKAVRDNLNAKVIKHKHEKMKKMERKLRSYFNS